MKITLQITENTGDPYTVTTNLYTVVAMERKFKIKASDLAESIAIEHLAFLAYESCKQHSVPVPPTFDDYLKRLDGIEVVSGETANPTDGEVTAED
jgi:hypothetical protein